MISPTFLLTMLAVNPAPSSRPTNAGEALWAVDFRDRVASIAKKHWLESDQALRGLKGEALESAKRRALSQYTDVPGYSSLDAPCSDFVTDILQDAGSTSFPNRPETQVEKLNEVNVSYHYEHLTKMQGWVHAGGFYKKPVTQFQAGLLPDSDRPLGCLAYYHRPTHKLGDIGHVGVIVGITDKGFTAVDASGMPYKGRLMMRNIIDPEIVDGTYDRITILCPPLGDK